MCSTRSSRFEASNDNKLAPCKNEPNKCICNTYRIIPVEFGHRKDFFSFFFFQNEIFEWEHNLTCTPCQTLKVNGVTCVKSANFNFVQLEIFYSTFLMCFIIFLCRSVNLEPTSIRHDFWCDTFICVKCTILHCNYIWDEAYTHCKIHWSLKYIFCREK